MKIKAAVCYCGTRLAHRVVPNEYGGSEPLPHTEMHCAGCGAVVPDWSLDYVWPTTFDGETKCAASQPPEQHCS